MLDASATSSHLHTDHHLGGQPDQAVDAQSPHATRAMLGYVYLPSKCTIYSLDARPRGSLSHLIGCPAPVQRAMGGGHDDVKRNKKEAADELVKEAQPLFQGIQLDDKQIEWVFRIGPGVSVARRWPQFNTLYCRGILRNVKLTQTLVDVIKEAGVQQGCSRVHGILLYAVATKVGTARG